MLDIKKIKFNELKAARYNPRQITPEFNKKMEQLANYLEIKHYPIINEKGG